jgi:ABC-2 type transport system ATP-binding protein
MTAAIEAIDLGRRYGTMWALRGCNLSIPEGSVVALVGPNGAGKTTLLELAIGLLEANEGEVRILGSSMQGQPGSMLARVGFVAQDAPLYRNFSVADMLRFGAHLNPRWDDSIAQRRLARLDIPLERRCGKLSGGQQAQVALAIAAAKRPDVLLLDEPVARLDPLARREFLEALMETVAESGVTVVLSSHLISDLERVCDHLVLLSRGHVVIAGPTEALLAEHHLVSGPRDHVDVILRRRNVIEQRATDRQLTALVRGNGAAPDPRVEMREVSLEELVLAYLRRPQEAEVVLELANSGGVQ